MGTRRRTKAEQTEATTAKLLEVAKAVFAEHGFAGASVEQICRRAEVTRGALYHHFATKKALFEAVFLALQAEIGARIAGSGDPNDEPFDSILAGGEAFLRAATEPPIQQIVLRDAPAVLGPEAWRRADEAHGVHLLRADLQRLAAAEQLDFDADAATALINGALNEAALWIAQAERPEIALAGAVDGFARLIAGLRRRPPERRR